MAKKKRRILEQEEEEYEFTPTEFNEREFILKDIYGTRVFAITMVLALAVGIIAAVICNTAPNLWYIGMLLSFATVASLNKLFTLMGFHPEMLDSKSMIGNYLVFLILALGVCIVGINAPF